MSLKLIKLELARSSEFPNGSRAHGYEFVAPLDADGHIDPAVWRDARDRCRVHRFWGSQSDEAGHLVRRPGGSWAFHYDIMGDADDDETGHRFNSHTFRIGDYVSIREHDDEMRTFQVASVTDVAR